MHDVTIRKKAMISQPMNGLTDEEIEETRNKAIRHLERLGYKVVNTLNTGDRYSESSMKDIGVMSIPVYYLARSLESMSFCDVVYFCDGWEDARGCRIEHETAEAYGLDIIYEEDEEDPEAPITDEQKTFMEGMNHTETVLDAYFDMILDAWSECSDEYQRSAKIIKNGVIKWLTAAKFERYTDFVKENESKVNE
jgi:hypothetical protein